MAPLGPDINHIRIGRSGKLLEESHRPKVTRAILEPNLPILSRLSHGSNSSSDNQGFDSNQMGILTNVYNATEPNGHVFGRASRRGPHPSSILAEFIAYLLIQE